jgi:signal transduction histidine kinase
VSSVTTTTLRPRAPIDEFPVRMLRSVPEPDPTAHRALLACVMAAVGASATPAELRDRLAAMGLSLDAGKELALMRQLAELGMLRVASVVGEVPKYVPTVIGDRWPQSLGGDGRLEAELADLERIRTQLIGAVAHELRTPLTAIRTSVGLLQDQSIRPTSAEADRLLANIAASAERMQRLVADVLDLARFRAGAVRLQLQQFDAAALARDVMLGMEPLFAAKRQEVQIVAPEEVVVFADRRRIEQVLVNLLSNANKFARPGTEVRLVVEEHDSEIAWSVVDQGPGIPPEDQIHLFEHFYVNEQRFPDQTGTGLGLPISLAIAQAHEGTVDVVSGPSGTTLRLRIPIRGPAESSEP